MKIQKRRFGNIHVSNTHPREESRYKLCSASTLADLLDIINSRPPRSFSMLKSVAARLIEYFAMPPQTIALSSILTSLPDFTLYLRSRRLSASSVRTYSCLARRLLQTALSNGWSQLPNAVDEQWAAVTRRLRMTHAGSLKSISRFATMLGVLPQQFSDAHLDQWGDDRVKGGLAYNSATCIKYAFRTAILAAGLKDHFPRLTLGSKRPTRYAIALSAMPTLLRQEICDLLAWKQQPYAADRPLKAKIRKVTARNIEGILCRLYGFAVRILGRTDLSCLLDLLTPTIIAQYFEWALNERHVTGSEVTSRFPQILAALTQYPKYKNSDFSWFRKLLMSVPQESESQRDARKAPGTDITTTSFRSRDT